MAIIETGSGVTGTASVDANNRLQVALPTTSTQAGYTALAGVIDAGRSVTIPISASTQGLLGTGTAPDRLRARLCSVCNQPVSVAARPDHDDNQRHQ